MDENKGSIAATIFGLLLFLGVGIGGGLWYFFYKEGKDPFKVVPLEKTKSSKSAEANTGRKPEDINDDGVVDAEDVQLVQDNMWCTLTDDCWDDMIGKTKSGDNPIFVYDLDVAKDSSINDNDVAQIQSVMGQ